MYRAPSSGERVSTTATRQYNACGIASPCIDRIDEINVDRAICSLVNAITDSQRRRASAKGVLRAFAIRCASILQLRLKGGSRPDDLSGQ